jgi:hypothetical protein
MKQPTNARLFNIQAQTEMMMRSGTTLTGAGFSSRQHLRRLPDHQLRVELIVLGCVCLAGALLLEVVRDDERDVEALLEVETRITERL